VLQKWTIFTIASPHTRPWGLRDSKPNDCVQQTRRAKLLFQRFPPPALFLTLKPKFFRRGFLPLAGGVIHIQTNKQTTMPYKQTYKQTLTFRSLLITVQQTVLGGSTPVVSQPCFCILLDPTFSRVGRIRGRYRSHQGPVSTEINYIDFSRL
jgi:hypothetical protein